MLRSLLLTIFFLPGLAFLSGQTDSLGYGITCAMRDTAANAYWAAPVAFLNGSAEVKTQFDLIFSEDVPAVAQAAMRFAANVWGSYLDSDVNVRVNIDWQDRDDDRLLASAGPATLFRGFEGAETNTWYPVALAEAISGVDLNDPQDADINVNANSTANWYFGIDGNTPRRQIDLVSVMLHELGHGLGFLSSVDTINENQLSIGFGGRFIIYDLFLETESGLPLTDPGLFTNPSDELLMAVANNDLVFNGPLAVRENNGSVVPLFAPGTFDVGSSVSHLNEATYRAGDENALMTPFLSAGEAVHDPGPVTLGIFADMGWPLEFNLTGTQDARRVELAVFPNPASDRVTVKIPISAENKTLLLHAVNGQQLISQQIPGGQGQFDVELADVPAGMYHLTVVADAVLFGSRIVVR
ncbi:T9SS type A sorting domain-containing protein [Neolewinella persica]|uniref:T9SS type A sorting domain-containing protein n=1 Tax=Neolewinella persica TaxID=70998 RepID=UPI00037C5143|nr:T9SS type A sorting domain-containing protein [Neolewinella persica]